MTQIFAMLLIAAQFYFGWNTENTALTMGSTAYAASSLAGYFDLGTSPIIRFFRQNLISGVLAFAGLAQILTGNINLAIIALMATHLIDGSQAATQSSR